MTYSQFFRLIVIFLTYSQNLVQDVSGSSDAKQQALQNTMDDDLERSDLLKKQMSKFHWGDAEQKLALQVEEKQYRLAQNIQTRAVQSKVHIREIVQESGTFTNFRILGKKIFFLRIFFTNLEFFIKYFFFKNLEFF